MSHTNSTPNYNLPQFVGTDKPSWLNDVNGAMSSIDTQMKTNADGITTADTKATTAMNTTGELANLNTTDKTSLVSAVNEVNTGLGVTSGVASSASTTATNALNKINAFEPLFNLTNFKETQYSSMTRTRCSVAYGSIKVATNADGSIGKIYGFIGGAKSTNSTSDGFIRLTSALRPTSNIIINDAVLGMQFGYSGSPNGEAFIRLPLKISTNGNIDIEIGSYYYNRSYNLYIPPCLYFMKDFGDKGGSNS